MTTFNEREQAFEARFAHDAELKFKVLSRRNKVLGEWVAAKLNLHGAAADEYVQQVLHAGIVEPGGDSVRAKVKRDLVKNGTAITDTALSQLMSELLAQSEAEIAKAP